MKRLDETCQSRWSAAVCTALVMLLGSMVPLPFQRRPEFSRFGPDKLLHLLGHARLTVALAEALNHHRLNAFQSGTVAIGGSLVYGFLVGFFQQYVPGRAPERADLVAGFLGSVVGVLWVHRGRLR